MNETREISATFQITLYSTVSIVTMLLNILTVLVILSTKDMRTKSNILLVNLAITDICIHLVGVPPTIYNLHSNKPMEGLLCDLTGALILIAFIGSNMSLTLIAIHRYILIANNRYYNKLFTKRKMIIVLSIPWLCAVASAIPPLSGWGRFSYNFGRAHCMIQWDYSISYLLCLQLTMYTAPLAILVFSYYKVIKSTKESRKRLKASSDRHNLAKKVREYKLTVTLILVVICFFSFYAPYASLIQMEGIFKMETSQTFSFVAMLFAYMNSMFDFWIYAVMSTKFRRAFMSLVRKLTGYGRRRVTPMVLQSSSSVAACEPQPDGRDKFLPVG